MLAREQNELITRVGPGTPMGEVLRRYWVPILLLTDLVEPDGSPVRVKILGEELVAFRDSSGRIGLVDEYCAHRCASLFLGRNEEDGLRCVFHGWKYDVHGQCIDMPNEPSDTQFQERIHIRAYPTVELGGLIWAYLGPAAKQPGPPAMEWLRAPQSHRHISKTLEFCNYVQAIEGGIDTVHSNFLHGGLPPTKRAEQRSTLRQGAPPRLEVERTDYGFRYAGVYPRVEPDGSESGYVRIYQFVMPFQQFRAQIAAARGRGGQAGLAAERGQAGPGAGEGNQSSGPLLAVGPADPLLAAGPALIPQVRGHLWVPIDDEHTWIYNWMYASDPDQPFTPEFVLQSEIGSGRGPDDEVGSQRKRTRANDWLIDRQMQKTENYTGIFGINSQDLAVQESMGPIVDRSREHLGTTDQAIMTMRQLFLAAIKDVQEGLDPPGVDPDAYRGVRATDVVLPKGARWQEAAQDLLAARR